MEETLFTGHLLPGTHAEQFERPLIITHLHAARAVLARPASPRPSLEVVRTRWGKRGPVVLVVGDGGWRPCGRGPAWV